MRRSAEIAVDQLFKVHRRENAPHRTKKKRQQDDLRHACFMLALMLVLIVQWWVCAT